MFSDVKSFGLVFIPINWIVCIIVSIILYFTLGDEVAFGYALGSITSYLTFGLSMKNTSNLTANNSSFKKQVMTGSFVRILISAAMIAVAFYDERFNFIATIVGILVLKLLLIIFVGVRYTLFKDKEEELDVSD